MATISRLKPGQVLYKVIRRRMGNTTVSRGVLVHVTVVEIDSACQFVIAKVDSGKQARYYERQVKQWKVNKPEPKGTLFGLPRY